MVALIVLLVATALCGLVLMVGPGVAKAVLGLFGETGAATAETVFTLVIFGGLLAVAMIGGGLCGINAARLGRRRLANLALGLLLGAAGVAAATSLAWLAGTLGRADGLADGGLLLLGSGLLLLQAASEEVFFRGWLQRVLVDGWGAALAVPVAALAFAALHVMGGARSPTTLLNLFLGGLLFGLLALRGGGLAAAIGAHFAWNWAEAIGLGLDPNPGVGSFGALVNLELAGATGWGGSAEGLNASFAMSLTLLALVAPLAILWRDRLRATPGLASAPGRSGRVRP